VTISYVCPHCDARQHLAVGRGYALDPYYNDLEISGAAKQPGEPALCVGTKAHVSLCAVCRMPSIEIHVVLKEKDSKDNHGKRSPRPPK
jgi:hypothetical protein